MRVTLAGLAWPEFVAAAGTTGVNRILAAGAKRERENGKLDKLAYFAARAQRAKTMHDMLHGQRPEGWTRAAWCRHCGSVWVDGDAAKADTDYTDHCPYCSIPEPPQGFARPHVTCAECRFFRPVGDGAYGNCTAYNKEVARDTDRYCRRWRHK